jgi:hypothetical protein
MMNYLLGRMSSMSAWIGALLFIAEILLHLGNVSTLMLVLAVVLVVVPEETVRGQFVKLTARVHAWLGD